MYTETQRGNWILSILVISVMVLMIAYVLTPDQSDELIIMLAVFTLTFIAVGLLFFRLKTEVIENEIILSFGIGPIRKHIDLNRVKEVKVVRNKWYYGWGIRYYGKGWLWNIWGLDGVELSFKDKKSKFRIGSQNSEKLKEIIDNQLHNYK